MRHPRPQAGPADRCRLAIPCSRACRNGWLALAPRSSGRAISAQAAPFAVLPADRSRSRTGAANLLPLVTIPGVLVVNPATRAVLLSLADQVTRRRRACALRMLRCLTGQPVLVVSFSSDGSAGDRHLHGAVTWPASTTTAATPPRAPAAYLYGGAPLLDVEAVESAGSYAPIGLGSTTRRIVTRAAGGALAAAHGGACARRARGRGHARRGAGVCLCAGARRHGAAAHSPAAGASFCPIAALHMPTNRRRPRRFPSLETGAR